MTVAASQFAAFLYDGETSQRKPVTVKLTVPGYLVVQELGSLARYQLKDIVVAEQLGNQPARIDLPNGARVEITDSPGFYAGFADFTGRRQWLHALESRWSYVLLVLLLTLLMGAGVYIWGVPALAKSVAFALPDSVDELIGSEGLEILDQSVFTETSLDDRQREALQASFSDVIAVVGAGRQYQLEFRDGGAVGANAFALPSGIIVLTDQLVDLAENNDELAAVLAHEVGHVRNRHSLRLLLQNSLVAGLIIFVTGDVSAAGALAAGVPTLLASAGYSRQFELDADQVAREFLVARQIPISRFADIIERLEKEADGESGAPGWLSTHPPADERMQAFR